MSEPLIIPQARQGPPGSGNGGWIAGTLATLLRPSVEPTTPIEVTLRAPAPLDTPLEVRLDGPSLTVHRGATLVAEAGAAELDLEVPAPPSWADALAGRAASPARQEHTHPLLPGVRLGLHPLCFCCGAEVAPDDGCHVEVGPSPAVPGVVGAWRCPVALTDDGAVSEPLLWTALDCPGAFAWLAERGTPGGLLGRITAQVLGAARADDDLVVTGWTLGDQGRRLFAGTAVHTREGTLVAKARATWFSFPG